MAGYTTLADLDLPAIAETYGLHDPRVRELKGGAANSSFHLTSADGEYVLTVLDNHTPESARRLGALSQALCRRGVPTVEVVADRRGQEAPVLDGRPVLLKHFIPGEVRDPLPTRFLPAAGELLAQLHQLPTELPELAVGTRRLNDRQVLAIDEFEDREFASWLGKRLLTVPEQGSAERPMTVCHGDLFADNIIVRPDHTLAVIDWETASLDDPLLDLGMAIVGLARESNSLVPDRMRLLVDGYSAVLPLSDAALKELPQQVSSAAAIIAFHRYYRHNVRYPDPTKAHIHRDLIRFCDSVDALALGAG